MTILSAALCLNNNKKNRLAVEKRVCVCVCVGTSGPCVSLYVRVCLCGI